jgi:hypothetical protein
MSSDPSGEAKAFYIGPHAPKLSPDDVQLVHRLWVNMRRDPSVPDLHHSDIITYALTRLAGQYAREKQEILRDLRNYRAAEAPATMRLGGQILSGIPTAAPAPGQLPSPPQTPDNQLGYTGILSWRILHQAVMPFGLQRFFFRIILHFLFVKESTVAYCVS